MVKYFILILLVFAFLFPVKGESKLLSPGNDQAVDTLSPTGFVKKSLAPVLLLGAGAAISHSRFEKQLQNDIRLITGPDFNLPIDSYTRFVPAAEIFVAVLLGCESKHHWFDQAKYGLMANVANFVITHSLKRVIHKTRPYGGNYSIPSGHTSFAFTNAALLHKEYAHAYPWLAYSGYVFATTSGTFRVLNNKHWLSDVLAGAGLGILVTELIYHFEPFKTFNPFGEAKGITFLPSFNENHAGIYVSVSF
jgi:hypothetical protein